jgi:signal transduction histidine kinase
MLASFFNWRTLIAIVAISIVTGTIVYANYLSKKVKQDELNKIHLWIEAKNTEIKANENDGLALTLAGNITAQNKTIPIIFTNEKDSIIDHLNLDSNKLKTNASYANEQLQEFKKMHEPIEWINPLDSTQKDKLYFGESVTLKQLKWYPIVQLLVVGLFILITLLALQSRNKSTQNQVWAGMAKETAHQLGTPLSSLNGWMEVLKSSNINPEISLEMQKDLERLDLISDRFGKIGSIPKFVETDILQQINTMADYMRKRASGKVSIEVNSNTNDTVAPISPQLFDWVIENLIKNGLDALEGQGSIKLILSTQQENFTIDVIDTGKGIARDKWKSVFKPGYTTKKRGWGLGLSLTKRIVEQYHKGKIFVKDSEHNKGTTFRIILPKYRV